MTDMVAGILLAAGRGHRLRPLTDHLPKPLLQILNRPLAAWLVHSLEKAGINSIALNTHHLHSEMESWAAAWQGRVRLQTRREPALSGPAGGLVAAMTGLGSGYERLLVVSGDAYTSVDFSRLLSAHRDSGAVMSVVAKNVADPHRFGRLTIDGRNRVLAVSEKALDGESLVSCGIYVLDKQVTSCLPTWSADYRDFDFGKHVIPRLAALGEHVHAHVTDDFWTDVGELEILWAANLEALYSSRMTEVATRCPETRADIWCQGAHSSLTNVQISGRALLGPSCELQPDVQLHGDVVVGSGARLQAGAIVRDCVVLPGAVVPPGNFSGGLITGHGQYLVGRA